MCPSCYYICITFAPPMALHARHECLPESNGGGYSLYKGQPTSLGKFEKA
ncbi:hypothetical protein LINGRAHAP2_LOCUS28696, partial [Linum grandiflorum]